MVPGELEILCARGPEGLEGGLETQGQRGRRPRRREGGVVRRAGLALGWEGALRLRPGGGLWSSGPKGSPHPPRLRL